MELVKLSLWSSSAVLHELNWFLRLHVLLVVEVINASCWKELVNVDRRVELVHVNCWAPSVDLHELN